MLSESKRRRIARKFLEKNFGKNGRVFVEDYQSAFQIPSRFELFKAWESVKPGGDEPRAFEVMYAPYISTSKQKFIAVSDSKEELNEIVHQVFDKERIGLGLLEYDKQDGYYVVYD